MKKRRQEGNRRAAGVWYYVLIAMLIIIGLGALGYPFLSTLWNDYRNRQLMSSYDSDVAALSPAEVNIIWEDARAYNAHHRVNNPVDPFSVEKEAYIKTHPYDDLLNPSGNGVMGELEIPKIGVRLPIFHGTGRKALEQGCGHLMGTSLPTGGKGNHAVLSAHRGLPSAKLFTDLDQLRKGDYFYLHILNKVLAYRVDQIRTVLPEDSRDLAIDPNQDYVTLVTCTPYGVNTHRLLVRGRRTAYKPAAQKKSGNIFEQLFGRTGMTEKIFLTGLFILALIIAVMLLIYRLTSRRKKEQKIDRPPTT